MPLDGILYYCAAAATLWINAAACGALWMGALIIFSRFGLETFKPDRQTFGFWGAVGAVFGILGSLYGLFMEGFKVAFIAPYIASGVVIFLMLALITLFMFLGYLAEKLPFKGR